MESETRQLKEKKRLPWFVRFLRNLLIVIIILIGGVFAAFYVNDKTEVATNDQTNVQTVYYSALSKSVDDIEETKKMKFSLEQIFVNSVIKKAIDSAGEKVKKYITGAYFVIEDNKSFTAAIKLKIAFFSSRISMKWDFEQYNGETEETSGFKFRLAEVKIGRIPGFTNLMQAIARAFKIETILANLGFSMGLSAEINLERREITYSYANFKKDLKGIIQNTREGEGSTKLEIFEDFLGRIISKENVEMAIDKEKIEVNISCNSLSAGDIEEKRIHYDYKKLREMINILLPKNESLKQKDVLQYLTYYYVHGYDHSSLATQEMMNQIDFSDYTEISDYKTYNGILPLTQEYNLEEEIYYQLFSEIETTIQKINNGEPVLDLTDVNFTTTMRENRTILGYASILEREEEGKIIFNLMSIKDFYCEINQNEVDFHIIVSLNGLDMNFVLKTKVSTYLGNHFRLYFAVEQLFLGENEVDIDAMKEIINVLVQSTQYKSLFVVTQDGKPFIYLDIDNILSRQNPQILNAINANNKRVTIEEGSQKDHLVLSFK